MQKVTDVITQGEDENGHGFDSIVLKDAAGTQYQLFVTAGVLELVKLEPEATDDEITGRLNELVDAFAAIEPCTRPHCLCKVLQ